MAQKGKPLGFPCEREVIESAIPIHSDAVSLAYLARSYQTANRLDQEPLDRPIRRDGSGLDSKLVRSGR